MLVIITLVGGCTSPKLDTSTAVPAPGTPPRQAAQQYLALAEAAPQPAEAHTYRLLATEFAMQAGDLAFALQALPARTDTPHPRRDLLAATLYQELDRPTDIISLLETRYAEDAQEQRRLELRVAAREAIQDPAGAATELTLLQSYPQADAAAVELRLWRILEQADSPALRALPTRLGDEYSGWIELAVLDHNLRTDYRQWTEALVYWRREFPQHPAENHVLPHLSTLHRKRHPRPTKIAVLLPVSGPFQEAGRAIREGILHAWWYRDDFHPDVRFYDTEKTTAPAELLQQALADGAEFVIGPLQKERLQAMISAGPPPVSMLALNRIADAHGNGTAPPYLVYYGLAPEDEALQVAEQAWLDGHRTALAVLPGDEWGTRILGAFRKRWEQLGGSFLESAVFDPQDPTSYTDPMAALLNIDASRRRQGRLHRILGTPLEGDPRPRADADFLFLAAPPLIAAQVVLQLRFYNTGALPIYANSRVHDALHGLQIGAELEGVRFVDMPARLDDTLWPDGLRARMVQRWQADAADYERLYAFGADAYGLITELGVLSGVRTSHYPGMSGNLVLGADGRITRYLSWAQYTNGVPVSAE